VSYSVVYKDIGLKEYKETWDLQEKIFQKLAENKKQGKSSEIIRESDDPGTLIFVEHPHVFTLGKSGSENNLLINYIQLQKKNAAFYKIDRGGDITYHGPGQLVGYPIFDLEVLKISLKEYIYRLEETIIKTMSLYNLKGRRLSGGTGVWLDPDVKGSARKICAIGVKASRFITMHGFAFNVNTDLEYFNYINPCGFTDKGVTSLEKEMGNRQDIDFVKCQVKKNFQDVFDLKWINQQREWKRGG
jgi:lipoyl(octanoyl) transferase